jgi:hypothetical protein
MFIPKGKPMATAPDKREPTINRLNRIVQLQPNIIGLGINLNELIKEDLSWFDRGKRR